MNYIQIAKTYSRNVVALTTIVLLASCGGGGGSSTTPPPPATFTPGALNDSGIAANQCYQAGSDSLVACNTTGAKALNSAQDGMIGRDVTFPDPSDGKLGFSFTTVAGGCVKDNVTGLIWEVKTTDGGVRDWTKTYTYSSAADFVTAVNASNLCGHNNWRLPTPDELQSIMDYSVPMPGPTIDTTKFPNTYPGVYWSGALFMKPSNPPADPNAWGADFQHAYITPLYPITDIHYVRLVQSNF